jgi:hypothetical protein
MPTSVKLILAIPLAFGVGLLVPLVIGNDLGIDAVGKGYCGIGMGLLTAVLTWFVLFMPVPSNNSSFIPGIILIAGGVACLGVTILLQFYQAYQSANSHNERTQHLAKLIQEGIQKQGVTNTFNVNLNVPDWAPPRSIVAICWFVLITGVWLVTAGIRIFWGKPPKDAHLLVSAESSDPA